MKTGGAAGFPCRRFSRVRELAVASRWLARMDRSPLSRLARAAWRALRVGGARSLLRGAALLALIATARPAPLCIPLGPPHQVLTSNPLVGVHTRLTDEVEGWKIERTLQMVREMGAPWIVEFFPWPYLEPRPGAFDWSHSDFVIERARHQGLTVIARLGWAPDWARPHPDEMATTHTYLDPTHYAEFADFVAAFAERYRDQVRHIIIWNEPNLSFEWGYRPVDPEGYTALLEAVYGRAHTANPQIVVLAGALAPTLEPAGSTAGLNDLEYLERMYEAGAAHAFDALAAHAYGLTYPPEAAPDRSALNFRRVELYRAIMDAHGDAAKPIYVTEAGWNDHPRWSHAVRPAERIAYTIRAYEWAREHWPTVPCVAMWAFRFPKPLFHYGDYYAFVHQDFTPRVIYLEVQAYARRGLPPRVPRGAAGD